MKAPAVFLLLLFLALRADTAPAPLSVPPHVVYKRGKQTLELIPCTVTKSSPTELEYDYGRGGINLGGTSGAPVLNAASEVVAINLGGGENGGKVFGMGNPCTSVLELLKGAK
jgi:hypothetical protein